MSKEKHPTPDIQPTRLRKLLGDLIDIYSPSGKEEQIVRFTERYLKHHGLEVTRQEVDGNRFNVIVWPENEQEIEMCLVGHLDTIAAYDLEDYGFHEEGDTLYGLGSTDMKAGCAAMMEAFAVLAEGGEPFPPIGLALVVGEEEESDGAKALVREYTFPWAIIGEPTNLKPCLGHYGYMEVQLRTKGKRVHSSVPELGHNAIESMLRLLLHVIEYAGLSPKLFCNVRQLTSYPAGFVVPDACESWLDLHLHPESRIDVLRVDLERLVDSANRSTTGLDAQIRFEDTYSGYRVSKRSPQVKALRDTCEAMGMTWEPQDFRSHSDGSVLWTAGVNPVILGPGHLEEAHTPEESVSFDQVVEAARLYLAFARSLLVPVP